ncbi:MAG: hypothetical protein EAZ97_03850 [Bacteroidetes bacterium]|nr:MAG: hypothetical protein EAZ97_03850 [Bacteroidota bacterium]
MEDLRKVLFENEYYRNTAAEWLLSFGLMIASILVGRILYYVIGKVVKKLTAKTKTNFDDILVDMVEEPFVFGVTLVGIWYSIQQLDMSEDATRIVTNGYHFLIIFNITWMITRLFNAYVEEYIVPLVAESENDMDDLLLPFIRRSVNIALWAVATIMALNNAGYDVGAILAGLGIGGLAFALAAKDTVANLLAAISIMIAKPFVVGSIVQVKGFDAKVKEIGMRTTHLEVVYTNRLLIVPNSDMVNAVILNVSNEHARMMEIFVRLPLEADAKTLDLGMKLMKEAVLKNDLATDKVINFVTMGEATIDLTTRFWVKHEAVKILGDYAEVRNQIYLTAIEDFKANSLIIQPKKPPPPKAPAAPKAPVAAAEAPKKKKKVEGAEGEPKKKLPPETASSDPNDALRIAAVAAAAGSLPNSDDDDPNHDGHHE